ncbi:hypothetical protein [Leptolyngbya sp. FACHB-16]|nr:hypothetical protein [Leptolyngbya sp. FACHB-16]MBD2156020.1 hypothetical protein [Leptolyngbya sp. FACHB-16]
MIAGERCHAADGGPGSSQSVGGEVTRWQSYQGDRSRFQSSAARSASWL